MSKTITMIQHSVRLLSKVIFTLERTKFIKKYIVLESCLGHQGIVELLIKNGADVNNKNNYDYTPLISAAKNGNFQIRDNKITKEIQIVKTNICLGHQEIVKLLVENGADVNAKRKNNDASLIWAASKSNFQI